MTEAKRLELKSKTLALESQLSLYRVEALRHDAIAEVLPLARDIAKRDKTAREAAVAQWQTIVTAHRKRDSEKQTAEPRRQVREGPDGKLERKKEERPVTTSLRHLLFAVLMVLATFVIGLNLPALLEVTVLQRTSFDQGGRRAISVLLKYSVAITGLFLACRTMNFTWSSVHGWPPV